MRNKRRMTGWTFASVALVAVSLFVLLPPTGSTASQVVGAAGAGRNVSDQSAAQSGPIRSTVTVTPAYPLKMSPNHRYFVDQNSVPVLVIGDAPMSIVGNLGVTERIWYFSDRQAKGSMRHGSIYCVRLIQPVQVTGERLTVAAWRHFPPALARQTMICPHRTTLILPLYDAAINLAASYGITVFLNPIETGSWLTTLRNNGSTKAFNYGIYVGNRYKTFPNIVWLHGNDFLNYTVPSDNALVGQVIAGIASVDSNHLQTIELDPTVPGHSDNYSNLDTALSSYFGADLTYTYAPTYNVTLNAYNSSPTTPVFLGEGNYEFENLMGYASGPTNAYLLRETAYWTLTSGGAGYLYGSSYTWKSAWSSDLAVFLDTPGASQINHINT